MTDATLELTAKELLSNLYHAAIDAVDGRHCVLRWLKSQPQCRPRHVIAVGKAATSMLQGALDAGLQLDSALVITKETSVDRALLDDARFRFEFSSHPVPDERSLKAGDALLAQLATIPQDHAILFLISGGASALVEVCRDGVDLELLQRVNRHLLASGKSIHLMNAWRKQFSRIKGGGLLDYVDGREATQLMISDVKGDDASVIGSGLLVANDIEADDDELLMSLRPAAVTGSTAAAIDTHIIASLDDARRAAHEQALHSGLHSTLHDEFIEGDALVQGRAIAESLKQADSGVHVFGGETTVNLPDKPGVGGRNQAMALAMSEVIEGEDICVLCAGTDGIDGNTPCAGAMVTGDTAATARQMGFDIGAELAAANSGTVLMATGDLFRPGASNTNVMDLILAWKRG